MRRVDVTVDDSAAQKVESRVYDSVEHSDDLMAETLVDHLADEKAADSAEATVDGSEHVTAVPKDGLSVAYWVAVKVFSSAEHSVEAKAATSVDSSVADSVALMAAA